MVKLSDEQLKVVQMAVNGESLFITGGAGTGKSLVIREIIRRWAATQSQRPYTWLKGAVSRDRRHVS